MKESVLVQEQHVLYADPTVFDVFTLPLLSGDPRTALTEPNCIVLTEKMAKKYFNSIEVLGKTIVKVNSDNKTRTYKITGVLQDLPPQSHVTIDFLESMAGVSIANNDNLAAFYPFATYLLLKPNAAANTLEAKLPAFLKQYIGFLDDMEKKGDYIKLNLTPLYDIHLRSNRLNELGMNGNIQYVYIFSGVALFILLLACINFMTLSTAHSANRAKEVGIRKVLGSNRQGLIKQFMAESLLISFLAMACAVVLAWALLPLFNQLAGKTLSLTTHTFNWLPAIIGFTLGTGLLAGAYPAFFLSAFNPIKVLKGTTGAGYKGSRLRQVLVVFQFAISIFLIIGTLIINNQLQYIQSKNLGFSRQQVLLVKHMNALAKQANIFKQEVATMPGVASASLSSFTPTGARRWTTYVAANNNMHQVEFWPVDENYLRTMNMQLATGRDFDNALASDASAIIINQTAAAAMGFAGNPIGQQLIYGGNQKQYHVIGVVKDFNFSSLRENVTPVLLTTTTAFERKKQGDVPDVLAIKASSEKLPSLITGLNNKWKQFSNNQEFDYSFMNEDFDALYRAEQRTGKIAALFTTLAIIIACLGLFGLAAYAAEQRTREIGIRKVLGANMVDLVSILSGNFLKLVIIAFVIATPAAWWVLEKWLEGFAYREPIAWWIFILAGSGAVLLALITVSGQFVKAALTNPVKSLKSE